MDVPLEAIDAPKSVKELLKGFDVQLSVRVPSSFYMDTASYKQAARVAAQKYPDFGGNDRLTYRGITVKSI